MTRIKDKTLILISSLVVSGAIAATPGPQGQKSNFYYFEVVPNEKLNLTFKSPKYCADQSERISIEEFTSQKSYPTTDGTPVKPIKVVSIYANSVSSCSQKPSGSISKKITISADPKLMSHVYITTSDSIEVSGH